MAAATRKVELMRADINLGMFQELAIIPSLMHVTPFKGLM